MTDTTGKMTITTNILTENKLNLSLPDDVSAISRCLILLVLVSEGLVIKVTRRSWEWRRNAEPTQLVQPTGTSYLRHHALASTTTVASRWQHC